MALAIGNWSALNAMQGMDDAEFARWADLLERRTGVVVPPARKAFLVTAVRGRMRETGQTRFDDYFREIHKMPEGAIEWITLVDRLTVHETHFFRHPPSFDLIANEWLPRMVSSGSQTALHAWSVGCATGEEAYTLAMVLDRHISAVRDARVYFGVTATDVSQPALAVGRAGLYPRSKFNEIPGDYRSSYVDEIDEDTFAIRESLRKRVGFAQFNLLDVARAPLKRLDLIYCQNVLIYFARERRRDLLNSLAGLLKPGGMLVLGAGEVTSFAHPALSRVPHRQALAFLRNR
ncbi:CheR family methyltransferase [Tahibacter amnicola]|uniref:protein-glutamate O-methyltransferase n=1 Tax=Tahibacter amnicola TaxID=2976241 RepID=A0ABY6BH61_9GAMM|nr:protein-glutamate O-methyltransferase CheR [Tahibacter amnicola]UXI69363.1 protein-glutamate O-methyltransferase CheR [Tahibacter amnicola]